MKSLMDYGFISKALGIGPLNMDVYLWKLEYMFEMLLPIYAPILIDCHET